MSEDIIAKVPFEIRAYGCRSVVKNLVDRYNLEWIWKTEGGSFIFEHIEGKVKGRVSDLKRFKSALENLE